MPDVWTLNPSKLRKMLQAEGLKCGLEPRIILDRDPRWTCYVRGPDWYGDIYIHPVSALTTDLLFTGLALSCAIAGALFGIRIERWRLRSTGSSG